MPETPTNARDLLRVAEAAALSGLSRKTIYNYLSEGRLMRHGLRRVPMVSRAELLGLMTRARPKGAG
jgi:predicted DNA-binding transcriptional regulator AlpA